MRLSGIALWVLSALLPLSHSSLSAQAQQDTVFVLHDQGRGRWCAFSSERVWKAALQRVGSMQAGTVIYSDDHLSSVNLREEDESGDWTVYDHYSFDTHQRLTKLSRMTNILPGDRSVLVVYGINNGKVTRQGTSTKQLSSGKLLGAPKSIWLAELPVATGVKAFPFFGPSAAQRTRKRGHCCVPDTSVP